MRFEKNKRVGRLTMLEKLENRKIKCLCDCGSVVSVFDSNIGRATNSCGCLSLEVRSTHKLSGTRQYRIWFDMNRRCTDSTRPQYYDYGGRGITVSEDWKTFEGFWCDMGSTYLPDLTLDRINPDGNYCKENCQWVSRKQQAINKRGYKTNNLKIPNIFGSNRDGKQYLTCKITFNGRSYTKCLSLSSRNFNEALSTLIEWRDNKRKELGFSEFHGVD